MLKKLFSIVLTVLMLNMFILPVMAKTEAKLNNQKLTINTNFVSSLDLNKSNVNQIVQFVSSNNYKDKNGLIIPKGTLFNGKIKHMKKSHFGYRRANALIEIDEMVLPTGQVYKIKGNTNKHILKGSASKNIAKGVVTVPVAVVIGAAGTAVVIVEAVSLIGILLIGPTVAIVGGTLGKLTKGVDYKRHFGDEMDIEIKFINDKSYNELLNKTSVQGEVYPSPMYDVPVNQQNINN